MHTIADIDEIHDWIFADPVRAVFLGCVIQLVVLYLVGRMVMHSTESPFSRQ